MRRGYDIVVVARNRSATTDYHHESDLVCLQKLGLL